MYVMYLERKQLHVDERQERALKGKAKALGISNLLERASIIAAGIEAGWERARYCRDDLYQEREGRWVSRGD